MSEVNFANAYKEVYVILQSLVKEDFDKIPKDIINVFEKNKNEDYSFTLEKGIELKEQKILPETRAILYNLFRDYLSEPWQREKIIKWQMEEEIREEKAKKDKYNGDIFYKKASN